MAMNKKKIRYTIRQRKKYRLRKKISGAPGCPRVCVYRSAKHTYAQIIDDTSGKTLASASTLEKDVLDKLGEAPEDLCPNDARSNKSIAAAHAVGLVVAERAKKEGCEKAVFDRNGFIFHGRVKAVAEGARKGGLNF